jgi:hypothetical protein
MEVPAFDAATMALVALVLAVAATFLSGVAASEGKGGKGLTGRRTLLATAVLAAWLIYSGATAAKGLLLDAAAMPPPMLRILVPGLLLVFIAAFSPFGARLSRLPYAALIGFHAFRLPLEGLLWTFHRQGRLPVQMTFEGRNFDILTGLSAIAVAVLAWRGRAGLRTARLWNLAGFALLLNIMIVAALSIPGPLRVFHDEPANTLVLHFPYVWIPAVFVMAAFFGHLLLFRKTWADSGAPTGTASRTPREAEKARVF